ncbi:PoNi-like cognate immunity protein [Aeromonas dhakensis]|uniref:PoNi-like cognate immunity protein n=1 Tax=Aeromonas dhakensis TaxID=196024 RepID=UPI00227CBDC1|nr:PoNi-like cognate immunity protein [Aeromonas dhakensis]WAF77973.1 PoNi-like cognate immunity protein [Aeromonas dhakensis]
MIRATEGSLHYWDEWVIYGDESIADFFSQICLPSENKEYRPQFLFEIVKKNWHQILRRYSRGDDIKELAQYFPPLLDAWEESERLGRDVFTEQQQYTRHAWQVNLDHYIVCFWLVGLALALDIPDEQWQRLLTLIGNEGEDALLDRVIASRQQGRTIGEALCHPKPYQRLLNAIDAPVEQQPCLLAEFVENWYRELDRPAKPGNAPATAMNERPYWYTYGDKNFEGGAYFGRWCVEAVAAVKAFGLDDSLCLGHEHYPSDLLRPDGPSTHPVRSDVETQPEASPPATTPAKNWLKKLLGW